MDMSDEGFLSRWSRRKVIARESPELADEPDEISQAPLPAAPTAQAAPAVAPAAPRGDTPEPSLPTMEDVARLTHGSDFSVFVAPGVDESVKNAAMKKLFSDPRYNVMDGLDVYIDDYGKPNPIPPHVLRKMNQSRSLRLFDDETTQTETAEAVERVAPDDMLAHAAPSATEDPTEAAPDEDPDLRLQQDNAAGRPGPARGPGA